MNTVLPINLPWKTELSEAEGVIEDKISEWRSGVASVEIRMHREHPPERYLQSQREPGNCADFEEHVGALFNQSTNCSRDSREGEGRWEGELAIAPPAGVEAIQAKK